MSDFSDTDDPSTARVSTLLPGSGEFDDVLVEALAGLVRGHGGTTGPVGH